MEHQNFGALGRIGIATSIDGTPCIAIEQDEGELFVQTYKGKQPMVDALAKQLRNPEDVARLGMESPAESISGTAYNVRKSHEAQTLVPEKPGYIALYLRLTVAELLANRTNLNLDYDLE